MKQIIHTLHVEEPVSKPVSILFLLMPLGIIVGILALPVYFFFGLLVVILSVIIPIGSYNWFGKDVFVGKCPACKAVVQGDINQKLVRCHTCKRLLMVRRHQLLL